MKQFLLLAFMACCNVAKAQQIDSIYVDLYTDSLKKGTFNYINIDGLLRNGKYLPLDTTTLIFTASAGQFSGNNLWVDANFNQQKITIKVVLKKNPALHREFDVYIKQNPDRERLKTVERNPKQR